MRKTIIMIGILCVFFTGCGNDPLTITVKNTTDTDITLTSVSEKVTYSAPIVIKPHDQAVLYAELGGDIDFTFLYNNKEYAANTGYADDYYRYTIQFSENERREIECYFITEGLINEHRRIHFEEVADNNPSAPL